MKIAIIIAAILVAAWAAVLAIRPDLVRPTLAQKKSDIGTAVAPAPGQDENPSVSHTVRSKF